MPTFSRSCSQFVYICLSPYPTFVTAAFCDIHHIPHLPLYAFTIYLFQHLPHPFATSICHIHLPHPFATSITFVCSNNWIVHEICNVCAIQLRQWDCCLFRSEGSRGSELLRTPGEWESDGDMDKTILHRDGLHQSLCCRLLLRRALWR